MDDNELTCKQLVKLLQMDPSLKVDFRTNGIDALAALQRAYRLMDSA